MKKSLWRRIVGVIKRLLMFCLNPRLLLCFGLGWMITNGWCYIFLFLGALLHIPWMAAIGGAYAAFLWFPFTPEKIVTVAIAIFLLRLLFPHDQATLAVLQSESHKAKEAFLRLLIAKRVKRAVYSMKRVIVIGCPGSGKSTFARALRDQTGLPLVHLDMLYWRADRTTVSHEEFDERLAKALAGECWIIDGNYQRTLEKRLSAADTVFFLDYKTAVCLDGIRARKGQARSDMPWVENETDEELCAFVESFRAKSRPQIIHLLKKQRNKQIIRFRTRAAADRFLAMLAERAQAKTDSDPL